MILVVELLVLLAIAVVLSSYERRTMALLHNRDSPVVYMLSGIGQPVGDGGKLLLKSTVLLSLLLTIASIYHIIQLCSVISYVWIEYLLRCCR